MKRYYITTQEQLEHLTALAAEARVVSIDTETYGVNSDIKNAALDPHSNRIRLFQFAIDDFSAIVDLHKISDVEPIKKLLMNPQVKKIGHNLVFDTANFLHHWDVWVENCFDTMLASRLLQPFCKKVDGVYPKGYDSMGRFHNLGVCVQRYLGEDLPKDQALSDWSLPELSDKQVQYAHRDVEILLPLFVKLDHKLTNFKLHGAARIEFAAIPAIADMQVTGWGFDRAIIDQIQTEVSQRILALEGTLGVVFPAPYEGLFGPIGINLNSPPQVKQAFSNRYGINLESTDRRTLLSWMDHKEKRGDIKEIINALIDHSSLGSMLSTCDELLKSIHPTTGRIHGDIIQLGQDQHRTAVRNPNWAKIPRPDSYGQRATNRNFHSDRNYRMAFAAPPGRKLVICDYAGNQFRIVADQTNDPVMVTAFNKDEDLHAVTAAKILHKDVSQVTKNERQSAKTWGFAFLFGAQAKTFMKQKLEDTRVTSTLAQCEEERNAFMKVYSTLDPWFNKQRKDVKINGYIETPSGRKIFFYPGAEYWNEPINFPVCATEADGARLALARLFRKLRSHGLDAHIVGFVYDEIVVECAEAHAEEVQGLLEQVMRESMQKFLVRVPAKVESKIGQDWSAK